VAALEGISPAVTDHVHKWVTFDAGSYCRVPGCGVLDYELPIESSVEAGRSASTASGSTDPSIAPPPASVPRWRRLLNRRFLAVAWTLIVLLLMAEGASAGIPITGLASWYGPGDGVATPWCTWTYRHDHGCGSVLIRSLDTGMAAVAPVIDFCSCYVGTPQERIIDLQLGVVGALGLDPAQGLYRVSVEPFRPPDTAAESERTWQENVRYIGVITILIAAAIWYWRRIIRNGGHP